ncbi:MAG: HlyD family efflux transporter periplasmic adaptor subunit [Clostridia bacterium]|nr:HlyD family efflux transporter periplasmic adaptor subunit [Clostridia bacterium]
MKNNEKSSIRKKKKRRGGFIGFLVFAFVVIVAANVVLSYGSRLTTTVVRKGAEEDSISAEGYVFREQTVINAPSSGYLYCVKDEDERVSLGETVMYLYKNEINLAANSELKEIEKKIEKLSASSLTGDVFSNDAAKIEQTISQSLRNVPKLGFKGDIDAVAKISDTVNSLVEKRRIISGEAQPADKNSEIKKLKAEKEQLEKEYNIERTLVHAPKTGAFTSRIDGLEDKLTLKALEEITPEYLKELDKLKVDAKTPEYANQGEPIGKIVNNFTWSIAARVPYDEAEGLQVGDKLNIRFSDISVETIEGTVSKITPEVSGKVILVVTSNKYIDMIYSSSRVNVEFIKSYYDGFRIPAKSLRMTDGTMGVYVIRNGKAKFLPVDLLYNGKSWVVVSDRSGSTADGNSPLKLYDELIISGKNLYDGKVVR